MSKHKQGCNLPEAAYKVVTCLSKLKLQKIATYLSKHICLQHVPSFLLACSCKLLVCCILTEASCKLIVCLLEQVGHMCMLAGASCKRLYLLEQFASLCMLAGASSKLVYAYWRKLQTYVCLLKQVASICMLAETSCKHMYGCWSNLQASVCLLKQVASMCMLAGARSKLEYLLKFCTSLVQAYKLAACIRNHLLAKSVLVLCIFGSYIFVDVEIVHLWRFSKCIQQIYTLKVT